MARGIIKVLAGQRPADQLTHVCTRLIHAMLNRERRHTTTLPHLISVRVWEPAEGVIEASAVYRQGTNVRLLAFRLERRDPPTVPSPTAPWTTTAIQLG